MALFGAQNRDGWGVGLTILTALANILPVLPEEEAYLALFHGARRVAADCDGKAPRREVADVPVDHAEQRDNGSLVGGDRVEIAHGQGSVRG